MNANDWIQLAGHPLAGRGGRPINPGLLGLPHLATKTRSTVAATAKAAKAAKHRRRIILLTALTTTPRDPPKPPRTRTLSDYEYWNATPMQRARSDRVKHKYRFRLA